MDPGLGSAARRAKPLKRQRGQRGTKRNSRRQTAIKSTGVARRRKGGDV